MNFIKTVLATALGFFLAVAAVFAFMFIIIAVSSIGSGSSDAVTKNAVLELNLGMNVMDRANDENAMLGSIVNEGAKPIGLDKVLWGFDKAQLDDKVKGILLRTDLYSGGFSTAKEIHDKILEFRKSGKFVYAYGEYFTEKGYYIASACDKVFLNPKGIVELNGLAANIVMYKGMLDKLGVDVEVFKVGTHKGAVEPFISESLSENNRTQIKDYITGIMDVMGEDIASARGLNKKEVLQNIKEFKTQNAQLAVDYKFIDQLKYEDEVLAICKIMAGNDKEEFTPFSFLDYSSSGLDFGEGSDKIAVVFAEGEIGMGKGDLEKGIYSASLVEELRKVRTDDKIKALVLRVNSPGGSSNASDIISREIELIKAKKPVIVSFGNVAASGGYYISCLADSIFAQANTITGSIGVFAMVPNTSRLFKEKLGLDYETVESGEYSVFMRPDKGMGDKQKAFFQNTVNMIYDDFVGIVAKGRNMDTADVAAIAQGHVYTGARAKELGLIDAIGGLQVAIKAAAWKANLKEYRLTLRPHMKSVFEKFFGGSSSVKAEVLVPTYFKSTYSELNKIQNLLKNPNQGIMMMPYSMEIN